MKFSAPATTLLILLMATAAAAEERLAVFEFFGRPYGTFCSAAGPTMHLLQAEYEGRAILLEYDYDVFNIGRVDRWWASGASAVALPLVMVGSGYQVSSGSEDYDPVYRGMIDAELARTPQASVSAYWRQVGNDARAYVEARNLTGETIGSFDNAALWTILWENADIGVSLTWVRGFQIQALATTLDHGECLTATLDARAVSGTDWNNVECLALLENRLPGNGRYDMLQAAMALPADLYVTPESVPLNRTKPSADLELSGPHVLTWTASADVSWLEVTPDLGSLPATVSVTLLPELRPPSATTATLTLSAVGDGMNFSSTVNIVVANPVRRGGRRVRADP